MIKPKQPSKLDDQPRIPIGESEGWMREILAIMPEEVGRREAEYQVAGGCIAYSRFQESHSFTSRMILPALYLLLTLFASIMSWLPKRSRQKLSVRPKDKSD